MKNSLRIEKLSDSFFDWCVKITNGFLTENEINLLTNSLENELQFVFFTERSLMNFQRIVEAQFDKSLFLNDLIKYPKRLNILLQISANSNFLTDFLVRNSTSIYQVFSDEYFSSDFDENQLSENFSSQFQKFKTQHSKLQFARRFKNLYLLKIALCDFQKRCDLPKITYSLSILAKVIVQNVFQFCLSQIKEKYEISSENEEFALISLGKLGGNELNYSSDLDFIAVYKENIEYENISFHEIFTQVITLFIQLMQEQTDQGFLYRIDFRLRPDGKYSPLAKRLSDYIIYYETKGEDWEAQMLLKAQLSFGSQNLFVSFIKQIENFIYKSNFDYKYFENVRKMKQKIEFETKGKYDIKRISGGIRDIEFSAQILQLLNGKKNKNLRISNTLLALQALFAHKLIDENELIQLSEKYKIFRQIEHFLQLENDFQTHILPTEFEITSKIAFFFGFLDEDEFLANLNENRKIVRQIFDRITNAEISPNLKKSEDALITNEIDLILKGETLLGNKKFDIKTIEIAKQIQPNLINICSNISDWKRTIHNFGKIAELHPFPSIFFAEMRDEKFLNLTMKLCENSEKFVANLIQNKYLLEDYLSRKAINLNLNSEYKSENLLKMLFYLNIQISAGILSPFEFSSILRKKIHQIISSEFEKYFDKNQFFLYSLGSFGSNELSFSSDIDLIIIAKSENNWENEKIAQNFNAKINELISPFSADYRLRPEGQNSQLVWVYDKLVEYLQKRASFWEFIALTKIYFIAGNFDLFNRIKNQFIEKAKSFPKNDILIQSQKMYRNVISAKKIVSPEIFDIKKSHGSLLTLDFITQTKLLLEIEKQQNLISQENRERLLQLLGYQMLEVYDGFRTILLKYQSKTDKQTTIINWNEFPELKEEMKEFIQKTTEFYKEFFGS